MIDERTQVHSNAKIADDVSIGPWSCIGEYVEIDSGTEIASHVVIKGPTRIGKNNKIMQFASLGEAPQHIAYAGEDTVLQIGDNNTIREFCTMNRGTVGGGGVTHVGDGNFFMNYCHVAHDCHVGNNTIFANNASIAGHVNIGDCVVLSAFVAIHQFCNVGAYTFVGAVSNIRKDVLPYLFVSGYTAVPCGVNSVGLQRRGFNAETIEHIRKAYRIIFRRGLTVQQALVELHEMLPECPEVGLFIESLQASKRGITR